jgi:hypothetical protein
VSVLLRALRGTTDTITLFEDQVDQAAPATATDTFGGQTSLDLLEAHTSSSGHAWTVSGGAGSIVFDAAGAVYNPTGQPTSVGLLQFTPPTEDYRVETDWTIGSNVNGRFAGPVFFSNDAGTIFYHVRLNVQSALWELYYFAPTATLLATAPATVPSVGATYTITAVCNGETSTNRAIEFRIKQAASGAGPGNVLGRVNHSTIVGPGKAGMRFSGGDAHHCTAIRVIPQQRPDAAKWSRYHAPTTQVHAGFRWREQVEVIDDPAGGGNRLLRFLAESKASGTTGATLSTFMGGASVLPGRIAYGTYEVRMRMDLDTSVKTSGVALTWPTSDNWPDDGENDFAESGVGDGVTRNPMHGFIHYASSPNVNAQESFTYTGIDGTAWHVYRLEWSATLMRLYVDDVLRGTVTNAAHIPQVPHFFAVQLDSVVTGTIAAPVGLYVDWARISQAAPPSGRIPTGTLTPAGTAYPGGTLAAPLAQTVAAGGAAYSVRPGGVVAGARLPGLVPTGTRVPTGTLVPSALPTGQTVAVSGVTYLLAPGAGDPGLPGVVFVSVTGAELAIVAGGVAPAPAAITVAAAGSAWQMIAAAAGWSYPVTTNRTGLPEYTVGAPTESAATLAANEAAVALTAGPVVSTYTVGVTESTETFEH